MAVHKLPPKLTYSSTEQVLYFHHSVASAVISKIRINKIKMISKRVLPDWLKNKCEVRLVRMESMADASVLKALSTKNSDSIVKLENDDDFDDEIPPSHRTRSSLNAASNTNGTRTRSARTKSLPAPPRPKPSFIEYKGKVEYHTELHDIALMSHELLEWVKKQETDEIIPFGFDMEWPFTFVTGPGRTAVIQLCADVGVCYVFHIFNLKKLPAVLVALLTHDKVCLHGVNIKNDCRKLERDFPEVNAQKMIDQCIDLGVYCNSVWNTGGRWSMERLVWHVCRLKINKDKSVRNSKWHIMPLTQEQRIYAAIDVYISQVMYLKLRQKEIEKETETNKFIEEFGEAAFNAKEKLL